MRAADARSLALALRGLLDGEGGERIARRVAEYVVERAMGGHLGYVRFLFDAVDGPIRPTVEEEWTFEPDCAIDMADDGRDAKKSRVA